MSQPLFPTPVAPQGWSAAGWQLGAHIDDAGRGVTFAVAAPEATRVRLELFPRPTGADPVATVDLAQSSDGIWRGHLDHVGHGALYGYRVWGPGWDVDPVWAPGGSSAGFRSDIGPGGVRFNPNKLLTDPYAREITHAVTSPLITAEGLDGGVFGTGGQDYRGRPRREHDTARVAPKAIVVLDPARTQGGPSPTPARPRIPAESALVYEAHVRNLTAHPSASTLRAHVSGIPAFGDVGDVPEALRGTYAGAAHLAPYLAALGFTTIELLPVHETTGSEPDSPAPNHWGYATVGFFAPNRMYAADRSPGGPTREFREMVSTFHEHGIEVWLDVVYNHTGEGGHWGDRDTVGLTGLMGFGTPDYYVLTAEDRLVDGATGCSNQTDASSELFRRLVLDSLTSWIDGFGVDGFRFDLAPVLGRSPDAHDRSDWARQREFDADHPLLQGIRGLAADRDVDIVAEPWDLWGYEVGNFPDGWGEWNGRYRDAVRGFLKGDGNTGAFLEMVNGDYVHFSAKGGPTRSTNFVTAHDGFTLMDLVSFDGKNNFGGPPFGPSDGGTDDNSSWSSGEDPALRRQRLRNFWAVLLLSRGTPMIVSGDEFGRTQNGNNNPYNLNTIGMWNNWAMAGTNAPTTLPVDPDTDGWRGARYRDVFGTATSPRGANPLLVFAAYLTRLRRDHPSLKQRTYGDTERGGTDVSYLFTAPDGRDAPVRGDRAVRLLVDGSAVGAADLLVLVNQSAEPVDFALADAPPGHGWHRLVDTAAHFEPGFNCWSKASAELIEGGYAAHPWSVVVLASTPYAASSELPPGSPPAYEEHTNVLTSVAEAVVDSVTDWLRHPR